ncbi:efflux RND transporter periplasmic adaptor subunit [Noviherbaspirillum pedocola]|uniref:Efflux RND transporter periplasmic adaptor subunit n=1 Tax=Noviherbaspirillum pedocola TaxID=2801341 RepID=A0A934W896_9BURK|nr:efflux RND transporter periplasmic adaptor subunit [Noviherbaspirillum pedocola]MBK4735564.1 efflux RND transporter periplasmic adaptor subunit [Noviherbaspirillum pedocola]
MKKTTRNLLIGACALLLVGAGAATLLARQGGNKASAASAASATSATATGSGAPRAALTVSVDQPRHLDLPQRLEANGNIAAWQEAVIGSEVAGLRLTSVRVNVGDRVRAGDLLASFAAETAQAEMAQSQATLAEAEAAAAAAQADAARARTLSNSGALSATQIAQYNTAAITAQARVEAARAAVATQRLRLKHTRVVAPDDGIISARSATVGAVTPAGAELFRMIRQGRLEWRAEVTAADLARMRPGLPATVHPPGGDAVSGRVRAIGPTVDVQSRTALVYVDLLPPDGGTMGARAGMYASGEFQLGNAPALTVPQSAIVLRDGFSYVFRVNADNRVSQLQVRTGRRDGTRVEVLEGVMPDMTLAVDGAGFLNDGDLVRRAGANAQ